MEKAYGRRRSREDPETTPLRKQRLIRRRESVTHLACCIVVLAALMHGADLPGRHRTIAGPGVVGYRDVPQHDRRGDDTRELARKPTANNPSQVAAEIEHRLGYGITINRGGRCANF